MLSGLQKGTLRLQCDSNDINSCELKTNNIYSSDHESSAIGKCWFENGCAYKHLKPNKHEVHEHLKEKVEALEKALEEITKANEENNQLKEKLKVVEKVLHAMTKKGCLS